MKREKEGDWGKDFYSNLHKGNISLWILGHNRPAELIILNFSITELILLAVFHSQRRFLNKMS